MQSPASATPRAAMPAAALIAGLVAAAALAALPAQAFVIDPRTYGPCLGAARCSIGPAVLSAMPEGASFAQQIDAARGNVRGLGIAHDPGNGFNEAELQGPVGEGAEQRGGEGIRIDFAVPQRIGSVILAHLFHPGSVAGDATERAIIRGYSGETALGTISVSSREDGSIAASGPLEQAQLVSAEAGVIYLKHPFPGAALTRIEFTAAAVAAGDTSDYSLARIDGARLPAQ
ncbi:hypothetical protein LNKW23_41220 [Paralimibaculum aggregatum]|uniref:Uncharacterized protein n=1 Tax=Paralimibaculum aggregatum TaxID=3036245 RepID=A0ABQ6LSA6_9RHOB|nr:hypothetical protein [Limibaculum sp. NKW23]GMG84906.1 hypothetical protein LNKW23_41220 [Limibaculum sp. NKW23]